MCLIIIIGFVNEFKTNTNLGASVGHNYLSTFFRLLKVVADVSTCMVPCSKTLVSMARHDIKVSYTKYPI